MGAFNKSIKISDWASGYANAASAKFGGERFWPRSGDFEEEIAKCERILKAFTAEGIETEVDENGEPIADKNVPKPEAVQGEETEQKETRTARFKRKVMRKVSRADLLLTACSSP